jgi:multidrug resistance efflux pump
VKEDVTTNRPQPNLPSMSSDQAVANAQNAVQREKKRLDLLKAKDKTSSYETQQRQKTTPIVNNNGSLSMKKESASEPTEGEMKNKQQNYSRKAQIVRNAAGKGKKSDNPEKFQKDPELSSEIHKT